ncbi:hypothetical protein THAOC_15126 [Thalassiosira oceanica]|uniref:Uncharacterized protein n=1 Tax=Thalassiosira oceanica TaxID=159749 RepID=K0T175_THAOC|nr:hypothetical protein THAOC_15126 [Thalassiosira oceanica]|eukprot:EJK64167.1 hypothetical protein THAOC_15126 [Thalassiosira oceanica]
MKAKKFSLKNTSHPDYELYAQGVREFEAEYGENWDAAASQQHDLMSYLLLNGADVNLLDTHGESVLPIVCHGDEQDQSKSVRLLLSWGAEIFSKGEKISSQEGKLAWWDDNRGCQTVALNLLLSSKLSGRRCEIVGALPTLMSDLVGKTCVVKAYIKESNQYKVTMEFTDEVLLLGADNLKRRDRTPQDPGYYNARRSLRMSVADEEELVGDDQDAEAKADQAAADLLAELGLEDLDGPEQCAEEGEATCTCRQKEETRGQEEETKVKPDTN